MAGTTVYYDEDCNLSKLEGKKITVVPKILPAMLDNLQFIFNRIFNIYTVHNLANNCKVCSVYRNLSNSQID